MKRITFEQLFTKKKAFSGQRPTQHPNQNIAKWDKQNAGQILANQSTAVRGTQLKSDIS
jgi:hypothetical protein